MVITFLAAAYFCSSFFSYFYPNDFTHRRVKVESPTLLNGFNYIPFSATTDEDLIRSTWRTPFGSSLLIDPPVAGIHSPIQPTESLNIAPRILQRTRKPSPILLYIESAQVYHFKPRALPSAGPVALGLRWSNVSFLLFRTKIYRVHAGFQSGCFEMWHPFRWALLRLVFYRVPGKSVYRSGLPSPLLASTTTANFYAFQSIKFNISRFSDLGLLGGHVFQPGKESLTEPG